MTHPLPLLVRLGFLALSCVTGVVGIGSTRRCLKWKLYKLALFNSLVTGLNASMAVYWLTRL